MTQLTTYYGEDAYADYAAGSPEALPKFDDAAMVSRSRWNWLPMVVPLSLCGVSYLADGQPFLTDLGFIALIIVCAANVFRELMLFQHRFGIGALILNAGTLIWFCYDYVDHWLGINYTAASIEPWVVAKSAFYHMLFVMCMVIGMHIKKGRWLEKLLHAVPEPNSKSLYFVVILVTFFIGMIPFLFFTNEPFYIAIWKSFWGGRGTEGATFTAGRSGNVNYNWGGYLAQIADVGMLGAVLAAFYAVVVSRQLWQSVICWAIWLLWLGIAFGTGTRGFTVFLSLPVIMLVFLKYSHKAALVMRKVSLRAYAMTGIVALGILLLVQVQGAFRNQGFTADQFEEVEMTELSGNEMFTTTLAGMQLIPDRKPFYYNNFPGEGLVRAMPVELFWLVTGPIPRALWNSKPIDPVNTWYSDTVTGDSDGALGTTISNGAVGHPYIRFGIAGVIQFGLLYGWAMAVVERSLRRAMDRPMTILFTLAFATFIFRSFRDLWWHNLYPIMIAGIVIGTAVYLANTFFGGGAESESQPVG